MPKFIYLHGFASGPQSKKARCLREVFGERGVHLEVPDLAQDDFENLTLTGQLGVLDRLAAGSPSRLIGSSMGGYLAALYAARHPEVERLVLLAPAFSFARRWAETLPPGQLEAWRSTGRRAVFHYGEQRIREVGYSLIEDGLQYEDYPAVSQPVLVFHGLADTVVPVEASRTFAAQRPNARLVELDSDHELLTALERIAWQTASFLI